MTDDGRALVRLGLSTMIETAHALGTSPSRDGPRIDVRLSRWDKFAVGPNS